MACHRPAMDGLPDLTKDAKAADPLGRLTGSYLSPLVRPVPFKGAGRTRFWAPAQAVRARCGRIVVEPPGRHGTRRPTCSRVGNSGSMRRRAGWPAQT